MQFHCQIRLVPAMREWKTVISIQWWHPQLPRTFSQWMVLHDLCAGGSTVLMAIPMGEVAPELAIPGLFDTQHSFLLSFLYQHPLLPTKQHFSWFSSFSTPPGDHHVIFPWLSLLVWPHNPPTIHSHPVCSILHFDILSILSVPEFFFFR